MKKRTKIIIWGVGSFFLFNGIFITSIYFITNHLIKNKKIEDEKRNEFLNSLIPKYVNEVFPNTTLLVKKTEISNQENTPVENISYFTSSLTKSMNDILISEQINDKSNYFIKNGKTFIVDEIKFEYEYGINVKNTSLNDIKWKYFSSISGDYYNDCWKSQYWIYADKSSDVWNNNYLTLPNDWEWNGNINVGFSIKNNIANYESHLIENEYVNKSYDASAIELTLENWSITSETFNSLWVLGAGWNINTFDNMIDGSLFNISSVEYKWSNVLNKILLIPALTCLI